MGDKETLIWIIEKLHELLGNDTEEVAKWLNMPIIALDNKSPVYWISEGRMDIVENLLEEIESGFCL